MEDKITCGINAIIQATGMRRKDILAHIETGKIKAVMEGKQFAFSISERSRLKSLCENYAGFFHIVQTYMDVGTSFRLDRRKCKDEIIGYAEGNSWFGAEVISADEVFFADVGNELYFIRKCDIYRIADHVHLWLVSYGESSEIKLKLLLKKIQETYPITGALLRKFFEDEYPNDLTASWILTDFLCSTLKSEITKSDDKVLDHFAKSADTSLPLNAARMFSAFLAYLRSKRKLGNGWTYQFQSRGEARDNGAYPTAAYLKMAYLIFNEDAWEAEQLKDKAFRSEAYANLWLFVAFHFVCGWRGTDIVRIPMPGLPCGGEKIRELLAAGNFDTCCLLEEVEMLLRYTPIKPNKTKSYNVPELKLFVAESLRKPLSFILSVAASYHENVQRGDAFIRRAGSVSELQGFFGIDFVSACDSRSFSTRRANKAYLQGIELAADNSPGKPKGYMLAALARSHKSGYGALPQTTEIYLRDARFSGYSPEFIAQEMFERGVFSFIPALLLDMYEGHRYKKLPVKEQTKLISEFGIAPSGLESVASVVQATLVKARRAISEIMSRPHEIRGSVEHILQNIASGNAPGRQDGFLCLMIAAGYNCADMDRSCCIGCGYEIFTKTVLRLLISEYSRLLTKKRSSDESESSRCDAILRNAVLPAISEIILSAERLYPCADMKPLFEEVERGICLC